MAKGIIFKKSNESCYAEELYKVGDIFITTNSENPSVRFGGTWSLFGPGRTLVCIDTNDSDFNTTKKTGGSKYLQDHEHVVKWQDFGIIDNQSINTGYEESKRATVFNISNRIDEGSMVASAIDVTTGNSGNLQPFITCYIWMRTA